MALAWMARVTARRRRLLAYPLWIAGLGLGCILLFSLCAWFAWHSPPARGGPRAALVFLIFVLLGVVLVVSSLADTFVLDGSGLERLRFGRSRRIAWGEVVRVALPWGGQGIRLEASDGRSLELAELLDGFGLLCDALLLRVPAELQVDPEASLLVLRGASLEPEALQLAYARWFEAEEAEPPEGMGPAEGVLAMGRAFGARLLWHQGSFLPFEARWTVDGRPRLSHGEPRGEDPGYASFRMEGREVVIVSDGGTRRESLDA
jgi:MFS family permease